MVKTRRASQELPQEEESQFQHTYPTRSREHAQSHTSFDQSASKSGSSQLPLDIKTEPDSPLLTQLKATRQAAMNQLARIQQIDERLRPSQGLLPVPPVTDADQLFLCQICSHGFDKQLREPVCLPCGHTICRECTRMIRTSNARGLCPFDRRDFLSAIDSLPVNSSVAEMLDGRMQTAKLMCGEHSRPYVGFSLSANKLLCGVCLIHSSDQYCFPFGSDEIKEKRKSLSQQISYLWRKSNTYLDLWKHCDELISLFSPDQRDVYGSIFSQPKLADVLDDITDAIVDISELVSSIISHVEERVSQLQELKEVWNHITIPEQLSVQLEDVYRIEEVPDVLKLATMLLSIPM